MIAKQVNEIRNLSQSELDEKIIEIKKDIFELKFKQATRQPIKTHLFKTKKRLLSQLLTIEHNYKNTK
uniref:ribosomal protein L29 n=1 Tax=Phymatolithon calcareum TaxID=1277942 RepID=UPI0023F07028|nr:ribosomal protein L29 [Phymatolithon calcareum]WEA76864.1 ribosomal protein L29 [Phymatolithon calcareum]